MVVNLIGSSWLRQLSDAGFEQVASRRNQTLLWSVVIVFWMFFVGCCVQGKVSEHKSAANLYWISTIGSTCERLLWDSGYRLVPRRNRSDSILIMSESKDLISMESNSRDLGAEDWRISGFTGLSGSQINQGNSKDWLSNLVFNHTNPSHSVIEVIPSDFNQGGLMRGVIRGSKMNQLFPSKRLHKGRLGSYFCPHSVLKFPLSSKTEKPNLFSQT
ncbi:unnamed protein product [Arabis nemorensis]|uniref:Uncharacterized protein n=1 Tax=Arabis nemorensis TaxID=586526 RepID=A0A565CG72_9BRAS|nr:unnamed protein product [Arabis nemorensis]